MTEEQLIDIFKEVGPVVSFRYAIHVQVLVVERKLIGMLFVVGCCSIVNPRDPKDTAFANIMV